jgi:hypothetical protein
LFLIDAYNELEARARNAERKVDPDPTSGVPEGSDIRVLTTLHNMKSKVRLPCSPIMKPPIEKAMTRKEKRMTRRMVRQSTIKNVRMLFGSEEAQQASAALAASGGELQDALYIATEVWLV